ncbi:MAG: DUF2207 domain-containing protein [Oscillospiraceae bacterium]|nr:DUF2207 domain-containing protein [Oscillospiraceae bacterium]
MRRILAFLICIILFLVPIHAANAAPRVSTTAVVRANGTCAVTIEADIRLDDPARGLKFPLGTDIKSVTLNGSPAPLSQSEGITSVNLSHLDGKLGLYSCTIAFEINSVVTVDDNGKQIVTVPLLYGFPYLVEDMSFEVTMPSRFDTVPSFHSGYHGQDIERQMSASISGSVIRGSVTQELKDSETLFMKLAAPEGMFPAGQTFGGSLKYDALAMGILAAAALLYWMLRMGTYPRYSPRRATPTEGLCAGQVPTYLTRRPGDLPVMVLQWAQLGYLIIHLDDNGRVFLHKKMNMGNERTVFEQRCFRDLFGRKMMVDASGYRFQRAADKAAALSRRQAGGYRNPLTSITMFRLLSSLVGLFAGIAMGDTIATDHTWRVILMASFGVVSALLSWIIVGNLDCLHTRGKAGLKLSLTAAAALVILSLFCNAIAYGAAAAIWSLLAGLLSAYGGKRTDNGLRIYSEILGLRRHMRKAGKGELRRILASNRNYYFELAPYALILGVDKTFAEKFGDARLPACTWLVSGIDVRTAPEWYPQLREVYTAMHRESKGTLAEKIFGK